MALSSRTCASNHRRTVTPVYVAESRRKSVVADDCCEIDDDALRLAHVELREGLQLFGAHMADILQDAHRDSVDENCVPDHTHGVASRSRCVVDCVPCGWAKDVFLAARRDVRACHLLGTHVIAIHM